MILNDDVIFKEKLTGGSKNDIRNLANYKVLDGEVHKIYVSWHWFKEKLINGKYAFFCDAIDLKQSVEGTLKV